ncbi:uncharacterized protein [Watersipora subatra]|uniref:uncharacterized protein n=1 Tax=Watersipora subatra TaxID=2589382 RepID=UPI00355B0396
MADGAPVNIAQRALHHGHSRRVRRLRDPKVPVVKVNPFMSEREHTWSKEKSLPEFYEKPDVMHTNTEAFVKPPPTAFSTSSDSMLTSRENRPILPLADLNKPNLEAANVSSAPQKVTPTKIRLFEEPPQMETIRGRKVVFPPTPRDTRISSESPIKRLPKHGFAPTIVDREKKTVIESPATKPTSLLNRERTQEFVSKQQLIKLRGLRMMDGGHLAPAPSTYLTHDTMANKRLEDFYRQLVNSYNRGYAFSPTKSRHTHGSPRHAATYDLHQCNAEPLLSVNHENVSQRFSSSMDQIDSKSAFRILETAGKPTSIEQNLARDYTMFRDSSKQGNTAASGHHFTRFLKLKNYNPTQGELFIMVNKEQNRPGNWSVRGRTTVMTDSEMLAGSEDLRANDASTQENTTDLDNGLEKRLAIDSGMGVEGDNFKENELVRNEAETTSSKASLEKQTSKDRLEISTTLPDINMTQS